MSIGGYPKRRIQVASDLIIHAGKQMITGLQKVNDNELNV